MLFGVGSCGVKPAAESGNFRRHAADDLAQRLFFDFEVVLRGNLLRYGEIVTRLCVVGVGYRRGADFKIAFRLRQLLGKRGFLGGGQRHVVPRQQYVEVGLRNPQDQVLIRLQECRLRLRDLVFRLLVSDPVLVAK